MSQRVIRQLQALGLAAGLVAWSAPPGRHPLVQAVLATALVAVTKAPLGLRPPALWAGMRLGSVAASAVSLAVVTGTAIRPVRAAMSARELPSPAATWLGVRIPLGTVWSEEAAYRAALGKVAGEAFGPRVGRLVQSTAFGLSHIADARATGEPVIGTVLVTGAAGWVFAWLLARSGSLAAPLLTHLALNEAGAMAALVIQTTRRTGSLGC